MAGMLDWGKEKVKQVGRGLLGAGTQSDATPEYRRYRLYLEEQRAMGNESPLPYSEWAKSQ